MSARRRAMDCTLEIGGCINGSPLVVHGRASEKGPGQIKLELIAGGIPLHWDLALLPLCLDGVLLRCASGACGPQKGLPWFLRSDMQLFDEGGRDMGRASCSAVFEQRAEGRLLRVQFLDTRCCLEPLELVTGFDAPYYLSVLPLGASATAHASAWSFETNRGNRYQGTTLSRRDHDEQGDRLPRSLSVDSLELRREADQRLRLFVGTRDL